MRTRLAAGTGAALAVVGGGATFAAAGQGTPAQETRAIIEDAAQELGIDSERLSNALEGALEKRVDESVAAGRLSAEEGEELKARIRAGELPLLGLRGGLHRAPHAAGVALEVAASYLGLTEAELRDVLRDGSSLADVARAEGKPVGGLVDALVAAAKVRLDEAVEAGRLTEAQRDDLLERLEERIEARVNASGFRLRGLRGGLRQHGSPPAGESGHRFGGDTEPPAAA